MVIRVGVTGSTGYIGRRLTEFLEPICHLTSLDLRMESDRQRLNSSYSNPPFDVIVHLGEAADADTNCVDSSTIDHLEKIAGSCEHLIYASSTLVYQPLLNCKHTEASELYSDSAYSRRKLANEAVVRKHNSYTIFRLSNVCGAGLKSGTIMSDIQHNLEYGKRPLLRDPNVQIEFIHMHDVLKVIWENIQNRQKGTFNVSSGSQVSGYELISMSETQLGMEEPEQEAYKQLVPIPSVMTCNMKLLSKFPKLAMIQIGSSQFRKVMA